MRLLLKSQLFSGNVHIAIEHGTFSAIRSMLYMRGNCKIWLGFSPLVNRYKRVIVCYSYNLTCKLHVTYTNHHYIYMCCNPILLPQGFAAPNLRIAAGPRAAAMRTFAGTWRRAIAWEPGTWERWVSWVSYVSHLK